LLAPHVDDTAFDAEIKLAEQFVNALAYRLYLLTDNGLRLVEPG